MRHSEDRFTLITAALAQWHDFEVLNNALPKGSSISLTDRTDAFLRFIVTGPKSRDILSGITDADLTSGWLTHQAAKVADRMFSCTRKLCRRTWMRNPWLARCFAPIYDALLEAGATPFYVCAQFAPY